ncbi:MAG: hypothetical protein J6N78_06630 [Clostridia bacterium]|nr:hypothetical protein [Clostridia bacterium]
MGQINVRKRGKVYEYFFEGAKLIIKEQEFQNQDLKQKMKLMNMDTELMKNIEREE